MNQHQRKFLLEEIEKQYKNEKRQLDSQKPEAPSLNNYLIAAILDGTAVMKSSEHIKNEMRERVRDLGKGESLITSNERYNRFRQEYEKDADLVSVPALILFEPPKGYAEAYGKYEQELEEWSAKMKALESSIAAMRIKVQVGSDKALEALVDQADKICSMSLTLAATLMLPSSK